MDPSWLHYKQFIQNTVGFHGNLRHNRPSSKLVQLFTNKIKDSQTYISHSQLVTLGREYCFCSESLDIIGNMTYLVNRPVL